MHSRAQVGQVHLILPWKFTCDMFSITLLCQWKGMDHGRCKYLCTHIRWNPWPSIQCGVMSHYHHGVPCVMSHESASRDDPALRNACHDFDLHILNKLNGLSFACDDCTEQGVCVSEIQERANWGAYMLWLPEELSRSGYVPKSLVPSRNDDAAKSELEGHRMQLKWWM